MDVFPWFSMCWWAGGCVYMPECKRVCVCVCILVNACMYVHMQCMLPTVLQQPTCGEGGCWAVSLLLSDTGTFLRTSVTPLGFSFSFFTRFFLLQPTWQCRALGVGVHIKLCLARPDLALSNTQAHKILTTIWSLTWITSSPASIFSQNSAGDCNAQANN